MKTAAHRGISDQGGMNLSLISEELKQEERNKQGCCVKVHTFTLNYGTKP